MAEVIRSLTPLGLSALAIFFIYLIYAGAGAHKRLFGLISIACIVLLAFFDKLFPAPQPRDARAVAKSGVVTVPPSPAAGQVAWFDTSISADWGGRDWAFTKGSAPKYSVDGTVLCDDSRIGYLAVCWDARPGGYPSSSFPNDLKGAPSPNWCTYKSSEIRLSTRPDGNAPPGRVFVCARAVDK
jgi:hypothetical protein